MTTSEWLRLAYFPCALVVLGVLGYIGLKYSQGNELPRHRPFRLLAVGAIALAVGVILFARSLLV